MPDDPRIDDVTMWLRKLFGKQDAPAPASPVDPMSERAAQALAKAFEAHGIACGRHDEWVVPNQQLPAVRGSWSPREESGQLDIQVFVKEGLTIVETFGGAGRQDEGFKSAMENFIADSLPVMLSALWDHNDPSRVTAERWDIASTPFTAVIGNVGVRSSTATAPPPPPGFFNRLHDAIRGESLTPELHWFRFHAGIAHGETTFESLRDNEPWPPGVDALKSLAWAPTDGLYSARLFLVLKPGPPSGT
jgi:hypothetical protein